MVNCRRNRRRSGVRCDCHPPLRASAARLARAALAVAMCLAIWVSAASAADARAQADLAFSSAMQALATEQWAQAELLLERTLMLNPEHAGARLELAGLLASRGRSDAARALIESLIADPRTPPDHKERLIALLERATQASAAEQARARSAATPRVWSEAFLAWAENPLARADLRQLTLTFPEGSVTLPVAQDIRPGFLSGLSVRRVVPESWSLEAAAQGLLGADHLRAYRLAVAGRLRSARDEGELQAQWFAQTQQAYDGARRHSGGVSLNRRAWGLTGGVYDEPEAERRGAFVRLEHAWRLRADLLAHAFATVEYAASGPPSYLLGGAAFSWSPAPNWTFLAQASSHRDLAAYSPWLEGGASRTMHTLNVAIERAWQPTDGRWQVVARAQAGARWSNLDLFDYRDAGLQISFRRQW